VTKEARKDTGSTAAAAADGSSVQHHKTSSSQNIFFFPPPPPFLPQISTKTTAICFRKKRNKNFPQPCE
jgi:hypothetical protein